MPRAWLFFPFGYHEHKQSQILAKIKTIENVIDLLDGIITKNRTPSPPSILSIPPLPTIPDPPTITPSDFERIESDADAGRRAQRNRSRSPGGVEGAEAAGPPRRESESPSPERLKNEVLESMHARGRRRTSGNRPTDTAEGGVKEEKPQFNHVHYDPEVHWCNVCHIFPKTAKEYLLHLHLDHHRRAVVNVQGQTKEEELAQTPWRAHQDPNDTMENPDAPVQRTPIRGLQFFVPATAWYCKLCDVWMGELKDASWHLKSRTHAKSYDVYVATNRNFEATWLANRQRDYEKYGGMRPADEDVPVPPPPPTAEELRHPSASASYSSDMLFPPAAAASPSFPIHPKVERIDVPMEASSLDLLPTVDTSINAHKPIKEEPSTVSSKKAKKKKSRKEERREKRKKKRSKKRKRAAAASSSSSSSSSSSESSESESDSGSEKDSRSSAKNEPPQFDSSNAIHAAMRNILKAKDVNAREVVAAAAVAVAAAAKNDGGKGSAAAGSSKEQPSLGKSLATLRNKKTRHRGANV